MFNLHIYYKWIRCIYFKGKIILTVRKVGVMQNSKKEIFTIKSKKYYAVCWKKLIHGNYINPKQIQTISNKNVYVTINIKKSLNLIINHSLETV